MSDKNLPLKGLRVVELGTHVAIPNATRCLADWGATVIKVESLGGEEWRIMGKGYNTPCTDDENPVFTMQNANKKFISLNLKSEEGMAIMRKLLETADVFASNVRLKSLAKLKLDYDSIKERFPKLIYAHFTGFGMRGSHSERPGFDKAVFWARGGGDADMVYKEGGYPMSPVIGFGDATVGNAILSGILAALLGREKTGEGTFLCSSLYACAIWYAGVGVISAQSPYNVEYPKSYMDPALPFSHIYKCKDNEWLIITVIDHDARYEKMCHVLGMEAYLKEEKYKYIQNVKQCKEEFVGIVRDHFLKKTSDEWAKIFEENDVVYERLAHFADIVKDEQAWENGFIRKVTYASGQDVVMPANPVQFIGYDEPDYAATGALGSDTKEVLAGIGYSKEEIRTFIENKSVVAAAE
ncbi:CoA transferase [Clostridia bacterium]|nr:CoA transferase [Clostridia bacterium]